MRAWLLACAALALARAAAPAVRARHDAAGLEHIKAQILNKLGLTSRPRPLGAPPRDVVRQILARAADPPHDPHGPHGPHDPLDPHDAHEHDIDTAAMREIIAIAHREEPMKKEAFMEETAPTAAGEASTGPALTGSAELRFQEPMNK